MLLAAGRGTRMGSGIRKQFMELAGRPVLSWSLNVLALSPVVTEIVLVIPAGGGANKSAAEEQEHIRRLFVDPLPEAAAAKVRALVPGGAERYNSVYNGLEAIRWPCDYVFIHDGARPLITEEMLEKLFRAVQEYKAVVAACPSKDTVKITDDSGFVQSTPDRSRVWNIQTPQCFEYGLVKSSYEQIIGAVAFTDFAGAEHQNRPAPLKITDDAMVVEYASDTKIRPVDTGYQNIKITTPEDLLVAEVFLRNRTER
ncbi:MAG: 2-C-methyl-D-erythritol 4-phosphate cytidylyltransferase [Lachnospiraceae bacterium]|nr:2-C-methyl-D-erythritol 4-phosphate cytidylyltransferase [Lachnospiraceae bacterium]